MKPLRIFVGIFLIVFFAGGICAQEKANTKTMKAVRFGKLWDAKGKLWTNAIVIVEGDKIRSVTTDASAIPAAAEIIDLSKFTGLPGLIDVHTHMTMYTDETPGEPMLKQLVNNPPAMEVFLARKGAIRTLAAGVTTVRDLGADQYMDIAMRDLINRGEMIGRRSPRAQGSPTVRFASTFAVGCNCCVKSWVRARAHAQCESRRKCKWAEPSGHAKGISNER